MLQVTPALLESPMIVALNCCFAPDGTVAVAGARVTATEGTVMVAEPDLVGSVTQAAVSVTFRLLTGGATGAVYVADKGPVGETLPHKAAEQVTVQFTLVVLLVSPCMLTSAKNCIVAPTCTTAVALDTETVMPDCGRPLPHPMWLTARTTESSIPENDMRFFDHMANLLSTTRTSVHLSIRRS
jgi:hypothetical protein